VYVKR